MQETITEVEQTEVSELDDEMASSVEVSADTSVDAAGLHATLDEAASEMSVRDFRCTECGIAHGHSTNKHRATDTFDISLDSVTEMEFNPNCHCGANEMARRADEFGVDESKARSTASSAPIPDETVQQMNKLFGGVDA